MMSDASRSRPWRGEGSNLRSAFARIALAGLLTAFPTIARSGEAGPAAQPSRAELRRLIHSVAFCVGLDPIFAESLARAESGLNPWAVSSKGCRGLFQLCAAARELGVEDRVFDPTVNTAAGLVYLRRQLERFGSVPVALLSYNAGGAVARRWTRDHTTFVPPESRRFVDHVLAIYRRLKRNGSAPTRPSPEVCSALLTRRID